MSPKIHPEKTETPTGEELARLLDRAQTGDRTVLPQLRQVLDQSPALWRGYGDLASQAEASLVQVAGGDNLLLSECLLRKLDAMKAELAGASPSPLEQLLAARIAACWLQISYYDALMTQAKGASPAQVKTLQEQQNAAHRRHLAAVKTLATIRKLLTPAPTPVEIATRLGGQHPGVPRRDIPVAAGVPVAN